MIAKNLKRLVGSLAMVALTFALAHLAIAQTTSGSGAPLYKTGTSVNVGQTSSNLQLSRDELNENTHHDEIDEELDSEDRGEDISHELRLQQLEAAQTPYKPQHIADENQRHADQKNEIAQKKAIENARHQQALAAIMAAAKSLLGGAAGALGNAAGGGGSPSRSAPQPGGAGNPAYPGGVPNNPALGGNGGSPANPNSGSGGASAPSGAGGPGGNLEYPGGVPNNPAPGGNGGSAANPNGGGGSTSNPNNGGGSASNPNAGGGSPNSPRLAGSASSSGNGSGSSPSSPTAGQRPLDFIPKALDSFLGQFQNGGQNLQNASNALRGVAQTFEDQWTKPNGGINQVAAMVAFHGIGGAIEALAPAIKSIAGEAGAAAPGVLARARAAAPGVAARAKAYVAKLFGSSEANAPGTLNGAVNAAGENGANTLNAGENATSGAVNGSVDAAGGNGADATSPGASGASSSGTSENPLTGAAVSNGLDDLTNEVVQIGGKTFDLGAMRGDPGAFGTVYDIKNMPGSLLKVVRNDLGGTQSIEGQIAGNDLLQKAGIATPAMEDISSGGTNAVLVQDVTKAFPGGTAFNSSDLGKNASPEVKAAMKAMFDKMGKEGLVWEDGALRNSFVYQTPNGLRGGILDTDRIFPFSEIQNQSGGRQISIARKIQAGFKAAGVNPSRATAEDYMNALYRYYYGG